MGRENGGNSGNGGKKGDDVLLDEGGSNILRGGRGDDSYYIDTEGVSIDEKNNGGRDIVYASVDYSLDAHVEDGTLQGDDDLWLFGNELDNVISGNSGSNALDGGAGDDEVFGGLGYDVLSGGLGNDRLDGGEGMDTAAYSGSMKDYTFTWVDDTLFLTNADGSTDELRNIETLVFDDQVIAVSDLDGAPRPPLQVAGDAAVGEEDAPIVIDVLANDVGAELTVSSAYGASKGTVTINEDNTLTYTPHADAHGVDAITYTVVDRYGETATATLSIEITPLNDDPVAVEDGFSALAGTTLISLESVLSNDTDVDGDTLTIIAADSMSAHGGAVVMHADGTFSYTAPDGFTGTDSFAYTVSDGLDGTSSALVAIDVRAPALVATSDAAATREDVALVIDVLANDSGNGLSILSATDGSLGTVSVNTDGTLTYTPNSDANGEDVFFYTIVDAAGQEATTEVSVSIAPENDAPVAVNDFYVVGAGGAYDSAESLLDNDMDPDGDALTVTSYETESANGGALTVNGDGTFSYTAAEGFSGTDRFAYSIADDQGGEHSAAVEFRVEAPTEPEPLPEPQPTSDYVDALLAGDWYRLNAGEEYGSEAVVTFAFATQTPDYYSDTSVMQRNFQEFSDTQKANTLAALEDVASFANLTFIETSVEEAEIVFGIADVGSAGFAFWPTFDGVGKTASDVWIDDGQAGSDFEPGTSAYFTLVHEIGHALGLTHPELAAHEENHAYTVMADPLHPDMGGAEATTFMSYDVAALQHLYGANQTHAAGDDTYTFEQLRDEIKTLWDGGGRDTIDLSAATHGVDVDLAQGARSTITELGEGNLSIAFGAEIENVVGGDFDDRLSGNNLDNEFTGGGGADTYAFSGNWGNDTILDFTRGEDVIKFENEGLSFSDVSTEQTEFGLKIIVSDSTILLADFVDTLEETDIEFL